MLDVLGVAGEVRLDHAEPVWADEVPGVAVLGGDEGDSQGPVPGPPCLRGNGHEPDAGAVHVLVPCRGELLASAALNGLNARSHRLKTVDALTEVNWALPWTRPVAMRMLSPSSVGSAISSGDTRASAAFASSSRAADAHSACSSNDLPGPGSMARLRNTFALTHSASWSYGAVTDRLRAEGDPGQLPVLGAVGDRGAGVQHAAVVHDQELPA